MKPRSIVVAVVVLLLMSVGFSQGQSRTEKFVFPVTVTGFVVGNCGTFDIVSDWTALLTGTDRYDKSGQFVQEILHYRLTGQSRYYNSTSPAKAVAGGPGEGDLERFDAATGLVYTSGPAWKIRVPGYGLIFAETGHLVFYVDTGQIVFNSGHNQFADNDLNALCNYLK